MTKISDERLKSIAIIPSRADIAEISEIAGELFAFRAHNSDSAEPVAWLVDPGAGSAMDKFILHEPFAFQYAEIEKRGGSVKPLYLASPPAKEVEGEPDHVYDPNEWEYTLSWEDREQLIEEWQPNEVHKVATLINGPAKWVAWLEVDGDYTAYWFDSEDEAQAALTNRTPDDEVGNG